MIYGFIYFPFPSLHSFDPTVSSSKLRVLGSFTRFLPSSCQEKQVLKVGLQNYIPLKKINKKVAKETREDKWVDPVPFDSVMPVSYTHLTLPTNAEV